MFSLDYAARSDVGLVRASNQDSAYAGPNLLLVADGMGGHAGGDVASAIAVAAMEHLDATSHAPDAALPDLEEAIEEARLALIHASATTPKLSGLGTTVVALLRTEQKLALAHMGDSRAYLLRDGELRQVTVDHTFVQHLVDTGRIAPEEAAHHPNRNVVMRVLSDFDVELRADLLVIEAKLGDRWLLCSDGLSGFVEAPELQQILAAGQNPGITADALIEAAKRGASTDNITALVADVVPGAPELVPAARPADARIEILGAAATGGPMPALVSQAITAVRLLPQPGRDEDGDEEDDAVPMTAAEFAAAGLVDSRPVVAAPPAPPLAAHVIADDTEPIDIVRVSDGAPISAPDLTLAQPQTPTWMIPAQAMVPAPTSPAAAAPGPVFASVINPPPPYPAPQQYVVDYGQDDVFIPIFTDDDYSGRPAPKRHPILLAASILGVLALLGLGAWRGYVWTQSQFYVGQAAGRVAIFRGVPANLGPITLHQAVDILDTEVSALPQFFVDRLDGTIRTDSLAEARERAERLIAEALGEDHDATPPGGLTVPYPGSGVVNPTLPVPPPVVPTTPPSPTTPPAGTAQGPVAGAGVVVVSGTAVVSTGSTTGVGSTTGGGVRSTGSVVSTGSTTGDGSTTGGLR